MKVTTVECCECETQSQLVLPKDVKPPRTHFDMWAAGGAAYKYSYVKPNGLRATYYCRCSSQEKMRVVKQEMMGAK